MSAANVNVVVLTGNLTRDPELRFTQAGTPVCKLRLAVNGRRKDGQSGEWVDKPNYFDLTVWGARGEAAAEHLAKGSPVAVDGRLDWREWEDKEGGARQAVEVVVDQLQFIGTATAAKPALRPEPEQPELSEQPEPEEALDEVAEATESEQESELASLTREQLDSRARDLGVEAPERMQNKAAVIAQIELVQDAYEFGEEGEEEELSY
jgi:single-strand DNA-binding protein